MSRVSRYDSVQILNNEYNWKAGLYIRLSREDGDKLESESVKSQKEMLYKFVTKQTNITLSDYYIDDGFSGTTFDRPEFQRLMKDIEKKKINCVIVKDLSRLGRNYMEAGKYVEIVFPTCDVRFISINDQIDSFENPKSIDNVIVAFKNILNDEYCRDISMKVRTSSRARRLRGEFLGAFACYGYLKDPNDHHKLIIDDYASENVKLIYNLYLKGNSQNKIAQILNEKGILPPMLYKRNTNYKNPNNSNKLVLWNMSTVKSILTNQMYIGDMVQGIRQTVSYKNSKIKMNNKEDWIIVKNTHEPIISKEIFDKVQNLIDSKTLTFTKSDREYILNGLCVCGDCNHKLIKRICSSNNLKGKYYFICPSYGKLRTSCSKHTIRNDILENTVLETIKKYVDIAVNMEKIFDILDKNNCKTNNDNLIEKKKFQRKNIENNLLNIYSQWKNEYISQEEYLNLKEKLENNLNTINKEILNLLQTVNNNDNIKQNKFISTFKQYHNINKLTRDIAIRLIDRILVYENNCIEIEFKFKDEIELAYNYIEERMQSIIQKGIEIPEFAQI